MPVKNPLQSNSDPLSRHVVFPMVTERDVIDFLGIFLKFQGVLIRDDATDSYVDQTGKSLFKSINKILSRSPVGYFTLSELKNSAQVNDRQLSPEAQNESVVSACIFFFLEKNLRSIRFDRELTHANLMHFMSLLADASPSEDLQKSLLEKNISSISVEPQEIIPQGQADFDGLSILDDETPDLQRPSGSSSSPLAEQTAVWSSSVAPPTDQTDEPAASAENGKRLRMLRVMVTVGKHFLENATVRVLDKDTSIRESLSGRGVVIDLTPGEYEIQIQYDKYKTGRRIRIPYDEVVTDVHIDLQQIFDY